MAKAPTLKDRIHAEIPGYDTALARERALRTLTIANMNAMGNVGDVNADYYHRVSAAVDNGVTDLDDLRESYAAEVSKLQARAGFQQLCVSLMQQSHTDADTALTDHTDIAFDVLRAELDAIMADVDKHRAIIQAHPATAEEALNAGPNGAKNWQTVTSLLARYDELRREHRTWALRQIGETTAPGFATIGQVRTFFDTDPTLLHARATTRAPSDGDGALSTWLSQSPTGIDPADASRRDGNIWPSSYRPADWLLLVADNQPWVPDGHTINACHRITADVFLNAPHWRPSTTLARLAELSQHGAITNLPTLTFT